MFDKDFYPTPKEVVRELVLGLTDENGKNPILGADLILEPSAGKGDIIRGINELYTEKVNSRFPPDLQKRCGMKTYEKVFHAVEMNPELQNTIRGMGVQVVGSDFLQFHTDTLYDAIVMNPPFSKGLRHLLKAWEVVSDGGLVACILPSYALDSYDPNLRNTVWEAHRLIEKHGFVRHLGSVFEDAERKTSVDVSAFYLFKPEKDMSFDFLKQDGTDQEYEWDGKNEFDSQVATKNTIKNLVMAYNRCRELFLEIGDKAREFGYYYRMLNTPNLDRVRDDRERKEQAFNNCVYKMTGCTKQSEWNEIVNTFTAGLKIDAWTKVFDMTEAESLMTDKVKSEFRVICKENVRMAFSEENIYGLLDTLFQNQEVIMRRCVTESFDLLTRYDKKNRDVKEGWKTNDSWRINRKVIVPYCVDASFRDSPHIWGDKCSELDDIDRSLAFLEGKKLSEVKVPLSKAIQEHLKAIRSGKVGFSDEFESTYFRGRVYMKGTGHFVFKDEELLKRFNFEAAKGKAWLPDDYKWTETQQRKNRKLLRLE